MRKYLMFFADPADIIEARRSARASGEDYPEYIFLDVVTAKEVQDAEFVSSAEEIKNLLGE